MMEAAEGWKFKPTKVGGNPVKVKGVLLFDFEPPGFTNWREELDLCLREAQANPNSAETLYNLASAYDAYGQRREAIETYIRAVNIKPDFALAYYALGDVYYVQKQCEQAIQEYKKAIRIKPDFVEAYYGVGWSYACLKKPEEALRVFEEVLKVNQDLDVAHRAYLNIATINEKIGRIEEAIAGYRQWINTELQIRSIDPDALVSPDTNSNKVAELYTTIGKYDEAIEAYKRTINIEPYSDAAFLAHVRMASVYEKTNRREEAMKVYEQALEVTNRALKASKSSDTAYPAYLGLGVIYERMDRDKEAIEAYKNAMKLRSGSARARSALSRLYLKAGDKESAEKEYQIVKRLDEEAARELDEFRELLKKDKPR